MFPAASLFTALLLAISIVASPVEIRTSHISLPITKQINSGGGINFLQRDRARAAALKEHGGAIQSGLVDRQTVGSIDITNTAFRYIVSLGIGSPATTYNLIIDTGSSNTWVGEVTAYVQTSTSVNTGEAVTVGYGSSAIGSVSFTGEEWLDTATFSPSLVITGQSIGVGSTNTPLNSGFQADGILGVGPVVLTIGTLTNEPETSIPTVIDNLYSQGTISEDVFSLSFAPSITGNDVNGELTFGGTDPDQYTGSIGYTPITSTAPASYYWGIDQSITYGDVTILSETAGIVDSGTLFILIASDAYATYQSVTGATVDETTGMLLLTTSQYGNLENLNFNVGSATYALTPNGQIWPRALNSYIGGSSDSIYSIVGSLGTPSGQGLDFINGQVFMERFYSVFDTGNKQVGLATTQYTDATTN